MTIIEHNLLNVLPDTQDDPSQNQKSYFLPTHRKPYI